MPVGLSLEAREFTVICPESVYFLSTKGPPQQDMDSEQAHAPSSLSAHEWMTWISRLQSSQTYTSPTFISLHDAMAFTTFLIAHHRPAEQTPASA